MRRLISAAVLVLTAAAAPVAGAQELQFYDTMSGANFVQWWQAKAVPACQKEVGATVKYASSGSAEVLQRIKAAGDGKGDIDLLFLAPDKIAGFAREGVLDDLRGSAALIPNLAKAEPPDSTEAAGTPLNGTGAPFFRYTYVLIYNGDQVKSPPKSWKELHQRRDEWKGRISYVDPRSTVSGAGRFFVASFLKAHGSDLGLAGGAGNASWDAAWQKLAEFEKANARKHAESGGAHAAQLATGEIWIGFHALDFVEYSKKVGTMPPSIKTVMLAEGVPGGAGYLAIAKNIPPARKQAAARFINCALSDAIQVQMSQEMFQFPGIGVWDKLPADVYRFMPDRQTALSARLADPPAEAIKHITDVWSQRVGY
ncbi:MAG: extracellular solute-binding protein [Alphaproteobacteria bacterium]|nr:extracellular solute-binding protein [Alphaproteobacteria bacterium]